jgi:hypothetical protein
MTSASTSAPCGAPTTPPVASSVVPASPSAAQPVFHVLSASAVPVSPVVHPHPMRTREAADFRQPKLYIAATLSPIPKLVRAALADPHWQAAMEEEYSTLISNGTWDLVPRPCDANVVTGKWIFKHKFKADRTLERYKARWVLHGFTQCPGVDYDETFSPVVKPAKVRTVLSLALSRDWLIHQLNIKNTFLHGTLTETVYCTQPTGFFDPAQPDLVYRLNTSHCCPTNAPDNKG